MQRVVAKISIPTADGIHPQLFRYQFETADSRYNELRHFVQQKYHSDFHLRYKDEEGELITIANEADVSEALETAQLMSQMLKVFVNNKKDMMEPTQLEISMELSEEAAPEVDLDADLVVEESPERSQAPDLPDALPASSEAIVYAQSQPEPESVASFEEVTPQPDPMERLFVASEELLKVYRSRFAVPLLIELNKILRTREIHPKNYPAEIAMIINTQNAFSEILQNPLYLDVVGPALFKVILPGEFIVRVNANAGLLKQLDAQSIAEYADTMIGSLCASASECKHSFLLRPPDVSEVPAPVVPPNLDPLAVPEQPEQPEPAPKKEESQGILSSVWSGWSFGPRKVEDPVPFVEPNAPVVAPEVSNTDFDLLSFVDDSLRDDEKASEERPSSLVMTPASHVSYRLQNELEEDGNVLLVNEDALEEEQVVVEDFSDVESLPQPREETAPLSEVSDADLKKSIVEATPPPARRLTHPNSLCSLCGMQPIKGLRYKCLICTDMNLCSDCEKSGHHDRTHPVIKFSTATQRLYAPHELSGLKDLIDPAYHTIFFTEIQSERAMEDAMNMSTYSAVSAASLNPILMMRYMQESLRNPAAMSRMLDPIPNADDNESVSESEFEVDVRVEEDDAVAEVRYQEQPTEVSPEPEIEFPQDDDFVVSESSADEADFDVKVDADVEPVVAQVAPVEAESEQVAEPIVEEEPVVEEIHPKVEVEQAAPQFVPQKPQPPQQQYQQPPPPPYQGRPATQQPVPPQYPSVYNYQYSTQHYAPGMAYPGAQPQIPGYPYYGGAYAYQQRPPYAAYPGAVQTNIPQQPRVPEGKPPPPPKQEEELSEDFLLESQPDAPKMEPVVKPVTESVVVEPARPAEKEVIEAKPSQPVAAQPVAPSPALPQQQKPAAQPAAPRQGYVPPVVSNLPIAAYPVLPSREEKEAPPPAIVQKPAAQPPATEQEDQLNCFCGVPLVKIPIGDLGSVVQCDVCATKVMKGEVYHCFEQAAHGAGGYDLCVGCVNHQIAASRSQLLPQTTHAGPVAPAADAVAPSAPPSAPPSATTAPRAQPQPAAPEIPPELSEQRKFKFFTGLVSLHEMGIGDVETNKKLLKIHKGNVSAVMQQYFDGNVSGYHY